MFNRRRSGLTNLTLISVIVSHLSMIAGVAMTLVLVPRIMRQRRSATSTTAWLQ